MADNSFQGFVFMAGMMAGIGVSLAAFIAVLLLG